MTPLTRKAFYDLARECRAYAGRLATLDADSVQRAACLEFNVFLTRVRSYDRLAGPLARLKPARPITRGMVLGATLAWWLFMATVGVRLLPRFPALLILGLSSSLIFVVFLVPPAVYGTSVEAIEGRVWAVVSALQDILTTGEMEFSEAAFFEVRDTLRAAADDLRQQVTLNRNRT